MAELREKDLQQVDGGAIDPLEYDSKSKEWEAWLNEKTSNNWEPLYEPSLK